jgi:endonuclease/exonuclease/phosphatase family metal-dependent hydrolase
MKLISLNVWGATQGQVFFDFLKQQAQDTDIFCFQEVLSAPEAVSIQKSHGARIHLFKELCNLLPEFTGVFDTGSQNHDLQGPVDFNLLCGLGTFVKKPFIISSHANMPIYGDMHDKVDLEFSNIPRSVQEVGVQSERGTVYVYNYHGIPKPGHKLDTPNRLQQSKKIRSVMEKESGPKILCGDFNLMPETESVKILEQGMNNLIKNYDITNTRNDISWKKHTNIQHFADYTFVSPEVKVKSFEVPYNLVSDHLPMILEF